MSIGEISEVSEVPDERTKAVADAAATARSVVCYSIEGAAEAMGLTTALLRDAEAGLVPINGVLRLQMERCYGVSLDTFMNERQGWKPRTPMSYNEETGILRVGTLAVKFRRGTDSNDDLLRGFSAAVRRLRALPPSVPLRLRAADIPVLAELIDIDDPELDERAQFWFGQTPETAQGFRRLMKIARTAAEVPA